MKKALLPGILLVLLIFAGDLCAQSTETNSGDKKFPSTLQPVNPVKYYGPRKVKKKKKTPVTYDAQGEYYDRMEKVWRDREKKEKTLERGGESIDKMKPPYFGHKKPPKIRPLGKRKYCKICGVRH